MTKTKWLAALFLIFVGYFINQNFLLKKTTHKDTRVFSQKEIVKNSKKNKKPESLTEQTIFEKTRETYLNGKTYSEYKQKINGIPVEPYGSLYTTKTADGKVIKRDSGVIKKYNLKEVAMPHHSDGNHYVYWVTEFSDVSNLVLAKVLYENGWKKVVAVVDNKVLFRKKIEIH